MTPCTQCPCPEICAGEPVFCKWAKDPNALSTQKKAICEVSAVRARANSSGLPAIPVVSPAIPSTTTPILSDAIAAAGRVAPSMPSVPRQLANAAGAVWRLGMQWLAGGPLLVKSEELDRRLSICQPCDKWTGSRCVACGCFGQLKARLESESGKCPEGKW
jgi:hypothetical protein